MQREVETAGVDDGVVVPGAQQHHVRQVGAPAVGPCGDVVGVEFAAPGAGGVAAAFAVDRAEQIPQRLAGMTLLTTQIVDGQISGADRA